MRISQFARKYDLSVQEVSNFLKTLAEPPKSVHPNAKLDEATLAEVLSHFDLEPEETEVADNPEETEAGSELPTKSSSSDQELPNEDSEPNPEDEGSSSVEEIKLPVTPQEEIAAIEGEIEVTTVIESEEAANDIGKEKVADDSNEPKEEEIILSDQLIEMIDSEEPSPDLEKVKLIKAPKKKLSGLKVLDKIEIPEDPKKVAKEQDELKKSTPRFTPEEKAERARIREEQKEKRRLEAKRKQEAYEARKAKREKEKETKRLKSIKEAHYKQKLEQPKPQKIKQKSPKKGQSALSTAAEESRPQPKTLLGKFWRWLNT